MCGDESADIREGDLTIVPLELSSKLSAEFGRQDHSPYVAQSKPHVLTDAPLPLKVVVVFARRLSRWRPQETRAAKSQLALRRFLTSRH